MKKIYLFALLLGMVAFGQAQTFTVTPSNTVNSMLSAHSSVEVYIHFTNTMQQPITLIWEETASSYPTQWFMTICDNISCYTLPHAVDTMAPCAVGDSAFLKIQCVPQEVPGSGSITYHVYDMNNPISSANVTFNFEATGVSVTAAQLSERFTVSPNPANTRIQLSSRNGLLDKGVASLYNLQGQIALQKDITAVSSADFDVADLAPGIYMLRYDTKAGSMTQKVVIAH